jgi:alanine transaminase
MPGLEKLFKKTVDEGRTPKCMVVINPGNPTGQILSRDNISDIIKFCYDKKLFLLADEVYQENIYARDKQFISFKKVLSEIGAPFNQVCLGSFYSISKGFSGE